MKLKPAKPIIIDLEDAFSETRNLLNLRMALTEACDWDEQEAIRIADEVFQCYTDLWEWSLMEEGGIKDNEEFVKLLRLNLPDLTNIQTEAAIDLIDHHILEEIQKFTSGEEVMN